MKRAVVVAAIMGLLVLAQGGFFALVPCATGIVACVVAGVAWLKAPQRKERVPLVALLFAGMSMAYLASSLANGLTLTTLAETGVWAACAGFSLLVSSLDARKRQAALTMIAWLGVATSVAGMLVFAKILPVAEGMVGQRLQFTFQYANAAAAWYGACAFLCMMSPDARLREVCPLPIAAMLLTQSAGGIATFVMVAAVLGIVWARHERWEEVRAALVRGVLAILVFGAQLCVPTPYGLVMVALGIALYARYATRLWQMISLAEPRNMSVALVLVVATAVGCALVLLPERAAHATYSLWERMAHIRDGLALWTQEPLLGVGPDNWQYLYPYVQTASYYVTVVHSSYVQILLDGGLAAFGLLAVALVVGVRSLLAAQGNGYELAKANADDDGPGDLRDAEGGWVAGELCVVALLGIHAVVEFDLQFASLSFLLAFMLSGPACRSERAKGLVAGLGATLLCLPLCVAGMLCVVSSLALSLSNARADYEACKRLFAANPLALRDVAAQDEYLCALYAEKDYEGVVDVYQQMGASLDRDALYAAIAYFELGEEQQATVVLMERMGLQPHNNEFAHGAQELADSYGMRLPDDS